MNLFNFVKAIVQTSIGREGANTVKLCFSSSTSVRSTFHQIPQQLCIVHTSNTTTIATKQHVWRNYFRVYSNSFASNLRRKASAKFLRRNGGKCPIFAFVGFFLSDFGETTKEEQHPSITNLFKYLSTDLHRFWRNDGDTDSPVFPTKFSEYNIGERLGKPSANAAVYSANFNGNEVALKIMFNYSVPSNSNAIYQAFEREYQVLSSAEVTPITSVSDDNQVVLPEHPNIIKMHQKFVDETPLLYDSVDSYPVAVPTHLHNDGYGRRRTLCLVMPKYTCTLREYLQLNKDVLSTAERVYIFREILEAVGHMERNGVSHRDLKSDNILVDYNEDGYQRVVLTDFGCCLAEENLLLPFNTWHTNRGGNIALMSPEIANAVPQEGLYLSYAKADAWTCGTLAYEIFNHDNPFYTLLQNTDYEDEDLQEIPLCSGNLLIDRIVHGLLRKDPENRLSACDASTLSLISYVFPEWIRFPSSVTQDDVESWLLELSIEVRRQCKVLEDPRLLPPDILLNLLFLQRITCSEVMEIIYIMDM